MRKVELKYPTKILDKLELPMMLLSFAWFCVLIVELVYGTNPILSVAGSIMWAIFVAYFVLRLMVVKNRLGFFKRNWFFVIAIAVTLLRFIPFLQNSAVIRAVSATFGIQVVWIFASATHGIRSMHRVLGRRGAGYALTVTLVVIFAGAAGMLHYENFPDDTLSLRTYPQALWWAAMQVTNIGSSYVIKSSGGRILCLAISIYAAAMFGYLTALIASFLIDPASKKFPETELDKQRLESIKTMQEEMARLCRLSEEILSRLPSQKTGKNNEI